MKIVVYAICKNESQFVNRWMDSMQEADQVVVLDTGSTDETPALLRRRGALVYEETISPWRFDTARNRSLELVDEDADLCVCTDLDELFARTALCSGTGLGTRDHTGTLPLCVEFSAQWRGWCHILAGEDPPSPRVSVGASSSRGAALARRQHNPQNRICPRDPVGAPSGYPEIQRAISADAGTCCP